MVRRARQVSGPLAFAAFAAARAAAADESSCAAIRVTADDALAAEWQKAVDSVRRELLRDGDCVPFELTVRSARSGVLLTARGRDDLVATRVVGTPSELVAVAMGLVASIPPDTSPAAPPEPASVEVTSSPAELPPPDEARPRLAPAPTPSPAAVGLELGGRFGMPTGVLSPELELHADVRLGDWFGAVGMRAAFAGTRPGHAHIGGYDFEDYAFGASGGRRFPLGRSYVELTLGPRIGVITEEGDVPDDGVGGTQTDLWIVTVQGVG